MQEEAFFTRTAKIWLKEGIIHKEFLPGAEETFDDALESDEVINRICQGQKYPLLVDFTPLRSMDSKARAHYADAKTGPLIAAVGGVTRSRLSKVIGNFFMGFSRPSDHPGKLFNSEEDAIEWLKRYRV